MVALLLAFSILASSPLVGFSTRPLVLLLSQPRHLLVYVHCIQHSLIHSPTFLSISLAVSPHHNYPSEPQPSHPPSLPSLLIVSYSCQFVQLSSRLPTAFQGQFSCPRPCCNAG